MHIKATEAEMQVCVIGCRENTYEFIKNLLDSGKSVSKIVTIDSELALRAGVPSWVDLNKEFSQEIPVYIAKSYALSDFSDKETLSVEKYSVGFCIGWQRILPDWFLNQFRNGVFGMHASEYSLPNGAGRSPINWGIINGATSLKAHIFQYCKVPDGGDLLSVVDLQIEKSDDIDSVQKKCRTIFNLVVNEKWNQLLHGDFQLQPMKKVANQLIYPKRNPEHGRINWQQSGAKIVDFVRAQTKPYPGSFFIYNAKEYRVWRAIKASFDFNAVLHQPGYVVDIYRNGELLVQASDSLVLLMEHDCTEMIKIGDLL